MYGRPEILVLDEATSSLDTESEEQVQAAIDRVTKGITAVVIAHRLSTVIKADKIVVLSEGRIEAMDTHAVLLDTCPLYRRLYAGQFSE
jgi:ATP-binding cassette, subfamily B, bacterial MsbA